MIQFDPDILKSFAEKYIEDLRSRMDTLGVTASGNFNKNLAYQINPESLVVTGPAYSGAIEFGRKPSGGGGSGILRGLIRRWIDDKGITPTGGISKDSLAFLITRKIHEKGTLLNYTSDHYKRTKPSKVIDGLREDGRIEELAKQLSINVITQVKTELIDPNQQEITIP